MILSIVFPPDNNSTAHLMGDLADDLVSRGHRVTVLTTTPHYNLDPHAEAEQPIRPFWGRLLMLSERKGVIAYHAFMPRKGHSVLLRLVGWLGFNIVSTVAGLLLVRRPDVLIAPSPPLTVGVSAWIVGLFHRVSFVYNVQEIYPDIAINLGVLKNKALISLLLALERFVYAKARVVTVIGPHMRQRLVDKGVPLAKIEIVPNFVDLSDMQAAPKDNSFSREHRLHDKFVVSYAGNIGPAQGLENFVEAAALLRDEPRIHFLLVGDGMLADALAREARERQLTNLTVLGYKPYSMVPQIYGASDLCLVAQAPATGFDAIPSKVYRIMACARPILASTDAGSDLAQLIRTAGCGLVVPPGSARRLADAVLNAFTDRQSSISMGQAGRQHVERHYARDAVSRRYEELLTACSAARS